MTKVSRNPIVSTLHVAGLALQGAWWLGRKVLNLDPKIPSIDIRPEPAWVPPLPAPHPDLFPLDIRPEPTWMPSLPEPEPTPSIVEPGPVTPVDVPTEPPSTPTIVPTEPLITPQIPMSPDVQPSTVEDVITTVAEPTAKTVIALLPIAALLLKGKEKQLRNMVIKITAEEEPKVYRIVLGDDSDQIKFDFEVVAGRPLRFFGGFGKETSGKMPPLFKPEQTSFGPFSFDRSEKFTECHIIVEDPFNTELDEKPIIHKVDSSHEVIRIVHVNPNVTYPRSRQRVIRKGDSSEWSKMSGVFVDTFRLPERVNSKFPIDQGRDFFQVIKYTP